MAILKRAKAALLYDQPSVVVHPEVDQVAVVLDPAWVVQNLATVVVVHPERVDLALVAARPMVMAPVILKIGDHHGDRASKGLLAGVLVGVVSGAGPALAQAALVAEASALVLTVLKAAPGAALVARVPVTVGLEVGLHEGVPRRKVLAGKGKIVLGSPAAATTTVGHDHLVHAKGDQGLVAHPELVVQMVVPVAHGGLMTDPGVTARWDGDLAQIPAKATDAPKGPRAHQRGIPPPDKLAKDNAKVENPRFDANPPKVGKPHDFGATHIAL